MTKLLNRSLAEIDDGQARKCPRINDFAPDPSQASPGPGARRLRPTTQGAALSAQCPSGRPESALCHRDQPKQLFRRAESPQKLIVSVPDALATLNPTR